MKCCCTRTGAAILAALLTSAVVVGAAAVLDFGPVWGTPPSPQAESRFYARRAVLDEVIAGKLSLADAAGEFQRIDAGSPQLEERTREFFPGKSLLESRCRQVVALVPEHLPDASESDLHSITRRLEEELQRALTDPAAPAGQ